MTQLVRASAIAGVTGGGPMAAPNAPDAAAGSDEPQGFVASDRVKDSGIVVDRHPALRTTLLMGGLGILAGGGMAIAASRLPQFALQSSFGGSRFLQWGGIAAAGIGAVLAGIGFTQGADRIGYVAKVDGSRQDALAKAAESRKDVGVVQIDENSWGVVDLTGEGTAIDEKGPAGISIGKPPVPFNSFVSEFGDAFVQQGSGWQNVGAPDRIDASSIGAGDLDKLTGAQLGVTPGGVRLVIGDPIDGKVHAERADAIRDSFERGDRNVAVVKVSGGYAAFKVDGGDVGTDVLARGFRVEPFSSVELLTADGLVGASKPAGSYSRVKMPVDDVSAVKVGDAKSLEGRRIGSGQMRLGSVVGTYDSVNAAGSELFEANKGPVVLLQLDGGVAAFKVPQTFDSFDTMLGDARHVALLDSTTIMRPGTTGEATRDTRLPRVDVTKVAVADAAKLEGRRIGTGNVELGTLVKTYPSVAAAGADQFEAGAPFRVVLKLKDGAAVYESKQFSGFETLLGGAGSVFSLDQSSWATTTDNDREAAGAGRVKVIDASTLAVGDAQQLVGKRFAMDGAKIVRISGIASTHGSLADAMKTAAAQGGDRYVVSLKGGAAIVKLDGNGNDVETGIQPYGNLTQVNGRLAFGTSGDTWSFRSRSIPFQTNEPLGFNLNVRGENGRALTYLGSFSSESSAYSSFDGNLHGGRYAVVHSDGPAGSWHVYEIADGGGGGSWDERLGDVTAVSDVHSSYNDYYRQTESPGSETVYHVEERRRWRERTMDSGTRTTADTGVQRDESVDWGRTNSLRAQREREREEARRRAEEEARRRAEEERRRQEQQRNSGGSSSSGGSSGSGGGWGGGSGSGSGGNSNPGSGGGYDPGGGGAGSDW
ncbi:MAG: hypothetical protein KDC46_01770 [Thermoleophilia bacterium]|nr:hypothetical protein [Thermoleophilia bacterium]